MTSRDFYFSFSIHPGLWGWTRNCIARWLWLGIISHIIHSTQHTHTRTRPYTLIDTHTHTPTHTHRHTQAVTHTHTQKCVLIQTRTNPPTHAHTSTRQKKLHMNMTMKRIRMFITIASTLKYRNYMWNNINHGNKNRSSNGSLENSVIMVLKKGISVAKMRWKQYRGKTLAIIKVQNEFHFRIYLWLLAFYEWPFPEYWLSLYT